MASTNKTLQGFMHKLKGDQTFRKNFLLYPVKVLDEYGITLSPAATDEIHYTLKEHGENLDEFLNCYKEERAL
jgi:hypothetical protein